MRDGYATAPDAESAHLAEDGLYVWVLRAIADSECADPAACATAALMANADSGEIDHPFPINCRPPS